MLYKLIIIGSGPAGYTAGIYAGRAGLNPLLFAGEKSGGQLINTMVVENWPGAKDGVTGPKLMRDLREQAEKFGTKIIDKKVIKVDFSNRPFEIFTPEVKDAHTSGVYAAGAIIVATGAESIKLNIPGEERLLGRGVATCAVCDALFYRDKKAAVVGGGDAAVEDALALTKFAKEVVLVVRREELRASKIMQQRVENNPKIKILWKSQVTEIMGEDKVEAIKINNAETVKTDGVFLAIGHKPASGIFKGQLDLDEKGYIKVWQTMTSVQGVFAAGDCVDYRYRQAITAAGMGCQAAIDAEKWLENQSQ
ncbi:thioredoxin-disulfide reductase [Candidatus Beckwithbacteria bacterium CG2_30_44_31]|uniref:Thioredoxin reductase n=1 Tax=Candidatus Beckwithbacteria bacterium CG2_30_44_31 TaxID=1805035 RepID=A0A1J5B8N6_9BACT|nr:MAG: thioredoxin-disulfide reductase [Candidatus Beckwithbacteria bacterium CG2_30_44_31]